MHTAVGHTCFRLRQGGGYTQAQVEALRSPHCAAARERDVYVYFKHEDEPTGALNAAAFLADAARLEGNADAVYARRRSCPAAGCVTATCRRSSGNYLHRPDACRPLPAELIEVSPATHNQISSQVLCHCHWQPEAVRAERLTVILLHGLEGSSKSQYVVGNANKMWRAGWNVVRMNMRNCGGTESLSPTLYHSGLSGDVAAVLTYADGAVRAAARRPWWGTRWAATWC